MTMTVFLDFKAQPNKVNEVIEMLKLTLPETRGFKGCLGLKCYQDCDDKTVFKFVEHWETNEDYQKYRDWRAQGSEIIKLIEKLDGEMKTTFFDDTGI